ncbi:hypothetical protein IMSHALPRED_007076 [Imshaugia aleurites]|uniref:Uncharacterized protein n=1 Tax=Imshaugia aleurites TaxID=172621 RepID=A0A8H3FS82_9LECA|nr:hypothetical protein IMSHALPRED_007076 [Imshaugia aleurites]
MNAHELVPKDDVSNKERNHQESEHEEAAKAVGATYGNLYERYHQALLTRRHTDHEPSCGSALVDVTAVHKDQLSWAEDIEYRPIELLSFYPPTTKQVSKKAIVNLRYDGKLLLDVRGKPLRDFPSLPLVISSMVKAFRVEAWMRSDRRMRIADITARMPVEVAMDPAGHQNLRPVYDQGIVRKRTKKSRNSAGLITWNNMGKTKISRISGMNSVRR